MHATWLSTCFADFVPADAVPHLRVLPVLRQQRRQSVHLLVHEQELPRPAAAAAVSPLRRRRLVPVLARTAGGDEISTPRRRRSTVLRLLPPRRRRQRPTKRSLLTARATDTQGEIPLRYHGRRQVRSRSQTCSELEFGLSSSSLAAS